MIVCVCVCVCVYMYVSVFCTCQSPFLCLCSSASILFAVKMSVAKAPVWDFRVRIFSFAPFAFSGLDLVVVQIQWRHLPCFSTLMPRHRFRAARATTKIDLRYVWLRELHVFVWRCIVGLGCEHAGLFCFCFALACIFVLFLGNMLTFFCCSSTGWGIGRLMLHNPNSHETIVETHTVEFD